LGLTGARIPNQTVRGYQDLKKADTKMFQIRLRRELLTSRQEFSSPYSLLMNNKGLRREKNQKKKERPGHGVSDDKGNQSKVGNERCLQIGVKEKK